MPDHLSTMRRGWSNRRKVWINVLIIEQRTERSSECQGKKCLNMRVRQTVILDREDILVIPQFESGLVWKIEYVRKSNWWTEEPEERRAEWWRPGSFSRTAFSMKCILKQSWLNCATSSRRGDYEVEATLRDQLDTQELRQSAVQCHEKVRKHSKHQSDA